MIFASRRARRTRASACSEPLRRALRFTACALLVGCASGRGQVGAPRPVGVEPSVDRAAAPSSKPVASASARAAARAAALAAPAAPVPPLSVRQERVLGVPISSIALGAASRIAALGDVPYVGDARGLRALPLSAILRARPGESDESRIFFGRDNEPRIMGTRRSSAGETAVYLRHTSTGWHDGREEIGQLGATTHGGLWGMLGAADPELVCRANALCIIKRVTGWVSAPAGSAPRIVELQNGTLWGLDASGLANIDARGWALVMPAPEWSAPRAFWANSGEAWVATEKDLFHFRAGAWLREPVPVAEPAAFWGLRPDSIWVVGKGGAAHFDGQRWRSLAVQGSFSAVAGRADDELWLGGDAGLSRVQPVLQ
jgi:hypothetical protein